MVKVKLTNSEVAITPDVPPINLDLFPVWWHPVWSERWGGWLVELKRTFSLELFIDHCIHLGHEVHIHGKLYDFEEPGHSVIGLEIYDLELVTP